MNKSERYALYCKFLEKWGKEKQVLMILEETAELQQAVTKIERGWTEERKQNLIEEVADVKIMLEQLQLIYSIFDDDIQEVIDNKLKRAEKYVETGNYGK